LTGCRNPRAKYPALRISRADFIATTTARTATLRLLSTENSAHTNHGRFAGWASQDRLVASVVSAKPSTASCARSSTSANPMEAPSLGPTMSVRPAAPSAFTSARLSAFLRARAQTSAAASARTATRGIVSNASFDIGRAPA